MRAISDTDNRCLPPRADSKSAGGASDLESLKSGKDETKLWLHSKNEKRSGFPPRTESPTESLAKFALALSGRLLFATFLAKVSNLRRPNRVRCRDSDLTSLQT